MNHSHLNEKQRRIMKTDIFFRNRSLTKAYSTILATNYWRIAMSEINISDNFTFMILNHITVLVSESGGSGLKLNRCTALVNDFF